MKNFALVTVILMFASICAFSQSEAELYGVKVYTLEGWIIKAKNNTGVQHHYSFSYVTEGRDKDGKLVSSTTDTYGPATIEANEERQLFTAPQDPNKKVTYKFTNITMLTSDPVGSSGGRRRQ